MEKKIPNQIKKSLKRWETQSSMLQFLYVFLGAIAIIAPLVVASFTDLLGDLLTRLVSFCGAFAVGLIGGFRLSKQANKMRRAYIELRSAIVRYVKGSNLRLALVSSRQIGTVLPDQEERLRIRNEINKNAMKT